MMNEINTGLLITNPKDNVNYYIIRKLGQGAFGEVWLAVKQDDRHYQIAIKFFKPFKEEDRKLFLAEYQRSANFHHEDVLPSLFYGEWNNRLYMGMKLCEYGTAAQLIGKLHPNKKDDETLIWNFIYDTASGLEYLHERENVVHQDIKPDNIMINSDGDFVIMDFGISVSVNSDIQLSSYSEFGSPAYMAPERFTDSNQIIYANDIWSLGVSIYEMAVGTLPFNGFGGECAGNDLPSLPTGWSKQLNKVMQSCFVRETWLRKRASEIKLYAEWVLKGRNGLDPWASYIPPLPPESCLDNSQKKYNNSIKGKATQRHISETKSRDTISNSISTEESKNNPNQNNQNIDIQQGEKPTGALAKMGNWVKGLFH